MLHDPNRVYVFDTTLRDGEQVPGCQLTTPEKIEIARELEALGVDIIEAGFPISSPGDFQSVVEISKAVKEPIVCADTNGYCLPEQYGAKIRFLKENVKNIDKAIISVHCHNDLGLATANSLAGLQNGARQVEGTINGIGERAGNTSIEEVVMSLKIHKSIGLHTNINTRNIYEISRMVSSQMRMPVQANKAIVGSNAFAHSSGIHQDVFLKNRENYEIIRPEDVGFPNASIVLTARSGRHALKFHLERLGFNLDKAELDAAYTRFLTLADNKLDLDDNDLIGLVSFKLAND